jgi:protein-tyrosine phosphatase
MILGNPDRLCVKRLGWPGNPHNILFGRGGRHDKRVVCIDAVVQRKPPQVLTSMEDASCEELAELAFNDVEFVRTVLEDALGENSQIFVVGRERDGNESRAVTVQSAALMQRGMIETWRKAGDLRGIFEMMLRNIDEWVEEFVDDMDNESLGALPSGNAMLSPRTRRTLSRTSLLTNKIRLIQKEAGKDELMTIKLDLWNEVLRGRMEELLLALESWVAKRENDGAHMSGRRAYLTTAFLNPHTARPFVDLYELALRLRHILRRLAILASALSSSTPSRLHLPPAPLAHSAPSALSSVFIGGAVAANSFHVLRSLGITHFLNATEDLFLPGTPSAQYIAQEFEVLRVPLRDDEDEDIEPYFFSAAAFIEGAVEDGGRCLVHCHAGQSRSCALVIAWLLLYKSFNLRDAVEVVQRCRPSAAPNAGYMRALGRLEEQTCGSKSQINKFKKKKPEALECPECGEVVGISRKTLDFHMSRKHK